MDRKLEEGRSLWGGGTRGQAIRLALDLRGIPYCLVNVEASETPIADHPCRHGLVVLAARQAEINEMIARRLNLRDLDGDPGQT